MRASPRAGHLANALTRRVPRIAFPFLRIAMGIVPVWIGGLKLPNPMRSVGLVDASPFAVLASPGVAYALGMREIVVGILFFTGFRLKYVSLIAMGLFVGTLAILILTPRLAYRTAGFPLLSLLGEFLLKDLVLLAASASLFIGAQSPKAVRIGIVSCLISHGRPGRSFPS